MAMNQTEVDSETNINTGDLGPLVWVLDETRKSLETVIKSLKRFVGEAESARGVDLSTIDSGPLRVVRQQLHQIVGALEMVGQDAAAQLVRGMEGLAQQFVQHPEKCTEKAASVLERAGFALMEYLEEQLGEHPRPALGLFPQFQELQKWVGADRIHPADLWTISWRWVNPVTPAAPQKYSYEVAIRRRIDQNVLKIIKTADPQAASDLSEVCLGLADGETAQQPAIFWKLAAGFFEGLKESRLKADLYIKRLISRILMQYAALAKGDKSVSERLVHDLLFFCAQSFPVDEATPILQSIRAAWGLEKYQAIDYQTPVFGLFDPSILAQARRRIDTLKEAWSGLAGGDMARQKSSVDQFGLVADSLRRLHGNGKPLADAFVQLARHVSQASKPPSPDLAMEAATAVLFLEASFVDFRPGDAVFAERAKQLAERLDAILQGGEQQPLDAWMEDLYRRTSDKQTWGTVVSELRVTLGEVEQQLDQFFRKTEDRTPLNEAASLMLQMRGVLTVLGLEQASHAVMHMCERVEAILHYEGEDLQQAHADDFEKLGNSLGALGFLIDMLGYQPVLAKKLFVFDEDKGVLTPVMGRVSNTSASADVHAALDEQEGGLATHPPALLDGALSLTGEDGQISPDHLEQIALTAALDDKAALAQAAKEAAQAARNNDEQTLKGAMDKLSTLVGSAAPAPAPAAPAQEEALDDDLLEIFLEEAREVIQNGRQAIQALEKRSDDMDQQTTLRRAYHTLKGSSRMVGLNEFGEAAWAMEQLMNTWLAEQKPARAELLALAAESMLAFENWVQAIADKSAGSWRAAPFQASAEAMRTVGEHIPLPAQPPVAAPLEIQQQEAPVVASEEKVEADGGALEPEPAQTSDEPTLQATSEPALTDETETPSAETAALSWPDAAHEANQEVISLDLGSEPVQPTEDLSISVSAAPDDLDLSDFDFDTSIALEAEDAGSPPAPKEIADVVELPDLDLLPLTDAQEPQVAATEDASQKGASAPDADDSQQIIGSLSISKPLYTVYVGEAREWARQLGKELNDWAADPQQTVPERAIAYAHSLAGASATVGFESLSGFARAAENAMQRLHGQFQGTPGQIEILQSASEEIQRVLSQFEAGALQEPQADLLAAINGLEPEGYTVAAPLMGETQPASLAEFPQEPAALPPLAASEQTDPAADAEADAFLAFAMQQGSDEALPAETPVSEAEAAPAQVHAEQEPASPAPVDDDGTQVHDAIDKELFELFEEEAQDLLPSLNEAMRGWVDQPGSDSSRAKVLRGLHTLKGSARLAGALVLGEMAHRTESAIEQLGAVETLTQADVLAMQEQIDALESAFTRLQNQVHNGLPTDSLPAALSQSALVAEAAPAPAAAPAPEPQAAPVETSLQPVQELPPAETTAAHAPVEPVPVVEAPPAPVAEAAPALPVPVFVPAAVPDLSFVADTPALRDIDAKDAIDEDLFPIFEEEADELMPQLDAALRQWSEQPSNTSARAQVLRGLHTLKGSARLSGAFVLGEIAHRAESAIESMSDVDQLQTSDVQPLLDFMDAMWHIFNQLKAYFTGEIYDEAQQQQTPALPAAQPIEAAPVVAAPAAPAAAPAPVAEAAPVAAASAPAPAPAPEAEKPAAQPIARGRIAPPAALSLSTSRTTANQTVRVRSQLLDRLLNQAGEVMTSRVRLEAALGRLRSSLGDMTSNLDRLRQQLRNVELQAETQMQSRLALTKDVRQNFDPLEFDRFTRMQELTRMMAESVNDVATVQRTLQRALDSSEDDLVAQARQSRELQRDLLRTRMVEFEGISERLYRVVRQAAKETGKSVKLEITGGSIEMDRGILDRMTPAFEHLLRNCVVHGIEQAAVRASRGKEATGTISIDVSQSGNDVSVAFHDDGGGLDAARICARAVERGLIKAGQQLSNEEIASLIFAPGFTTMSQVTELAGRGVGMDVVRTEIQALGGRIETTFTEGKGSTFRLVMPLTTAVTHVVMVRAGALSIGVPSNQVDIIHRAGPEVLQQAYENGTFMHEGQALHFYWAGALLQNSPRSTEPPSRSTPVVIFRSADQRIAVHVDEVLGNQEVVVKGLGQQLARLPGLVAVTALASGAVALIYNLVALATVYGARARAFAISKGEADRLAAAAAKSSIPLVLVVDDSITVRRVTQRLLQREGYRVALAADGLQGLERLREERPTVVLSDIEMPRMDGFDFVRNIRADETMRDLPVIMITSRIAEKHRDHAHELGVSHYLGKPYSEDELLQLIKDYAAQQAGAAAEEAAAKT